MTATLPTAASAVATIGGQSITLYADTLNLDQKRLREYANMDGGSGRIAKYELYEAYYDGEQPAWLTNRQRQTLDPHGLGFADNFCEAVVDAKANRTKLTGWAVAGDDDLPDSDEDTPTDPGQTAVGSRGTVADDTPAQQTEDWVNDVLWPANQMDDESGTVHTATYMKGDGFVLVDWDAEERRPTLMYHRPEALRPFYDPNRPRVLQMVSKVWDTEDAAITNPHGRPITRMNLYFPDRIEKYYRTTNDDTGTWYLHLDTGDESWPLPWVDGEGKPLGIPVFHFRNKPKGKCFGRSELRKVIPQQDMLNKWMLALDQVMDEQGWPQRWATGVSQGDALQVAIAEFLEASNPDAKFGQFAPADPKGLLDAIESLLQHVAAASGTPIHNILLRGTLPSGESLKTAEAPLVAAVEDRQPGFGDTWSQAVRFAIRLNNARVDRLVVVPEKDTAGVPLQLEPQWKEVESRNDQSFVAVLETLERLGLSRATALRMFGIPNVEDELEASAADADAAANRNALDFNRGALPTAADTGQGSAYEADTPPAPEPTVQA